MLPKKAGHLGGRFATDTVKRQLDFMTLGPGLDKLLGFQFTQLVVGQDMGSSEFCQSFGDLFVARAVADDVDGFNTQGFCELDDCLAHTRVCTVLDYIVTYCVIFCGDKTMDVMLLSVFLS